MDHVMDHRSVTMAMFSVYCCSFAMNLTPK